MCFMGLSVSRPGPLRGVVAEAPCGIAVGALVQSYTYQRGQHRQQQPDGYRPVQPLYESL